MRLDHWLGQLDTLTSTQLYGVIVAATVALCFALLGSGSTSLNHPASVLKMEPNSNNDKKKKKKMMKQDVVSKPTSSSSSQQQQEPKWYILVVFNVLTTLGFLLSVAHFSIHASTYWQDSQLLLQFLVGWSVFLCYFFGFFGISFVHDQVLAAADADENVTTTTTATASESNASSSTTTKDNLEDDDDPSMIKKPKQFCQQGQVVILKPPPPPKQAPSTTTQHVGDTTTVTTTIPKNLQELSDEQVCHLVLTNHLKDHELEARLDPNRAVVVRRRIMNHKVLASRGVTTSSDDNNNHNNNNNTHPPPQRKNPLDELPVFPSLDYTKVYGANCEVVIGYVPLPVGLVGPLTLNCESNIYVPMATTEGCLVASTNRGVKAITECGGANACILRDGITRAPCIRMASAMEAAALAQWIKVPHHTTKLRAAFESTTSFGKLRAVIPTVAGRNVYLRLECFSGDAMGMNMVSKGSLAVIELLQEEFPSLQLVALSGNMCSDKKASATNWIHGRGKSVVVEAIILKHVVHHVLKTTVQAMVHVNIQKNLIGSAMAGTSVGGFNAHASNIVTAVFLATGQDPAQNVESSNCITLMEETPQGDLWISCTMPSLEVGTVGGGTSLQAQAACLDIMNCRGASGHVPGEHAQRLAQIIAAATMAGELSLLAALAANTLVQAHMTHNRKK
jgi:hydroxymethylglutaryl-CoA reductase (NADPH)